MIPVLAATVEPKQVPEGLRNLQHIDLTDNTQPRDYQTDESQLLKLLNTDVAYHTEHKTWLVQALKWQRQQQNPTLLLRGYNLRRAETWLKLARTHRYPPTPLHEQFIAESLRQPPDAALDVFISYSRVDSDFARRLNEALQTQGKRTWFDQESIATGSDFQQEIYRGIESSDVFVFVLSPESVNSPFCADEVEYAQGLHKRMVTVLHRAIDVADLHPVLAKLQWLDFRDRDGDFQANFAGLLRSLDTDREHLETHTRLLVRSGEWDRRGRDESLLLRGQDLQTAETWLTTNAAVEPQPTGLQQEYIRAARARQEAEAAAERKLRRGMRLGALAAAAGIVVAAGSGWFAWNQQQKATASIEEANERIAQADTRVNEADQKVATATQQAEAATQQTQQAKQDQQQAVAAAEEAAAAQQTAETRAREADSKALTAATAQQQAEASAQDAEAKAQDAEVRARDANIKTAEAERAQRLAQIGTRLEQGGVAALRRVEFDQIGALFRAIQSGIELQNLIRGSDILMNAVSEYPAIIPILALQQLQHDFSSSLLAHEGRITSTSFSPDSTQVITASEDGTARVWNLKTKESRVLKGHRKAITSSDFSSDGYQVVTASEDGTARVWNLRSGDSIVLEGHTGSITSVSFSPDSKYILTASTDSTARVWDLQNQNFKVLSGHREAVINAGFSPDSTHVVTSSFNTARVWNLENDSSKIFEGHERTINSVNFSPDGTQIVTASWDGTARIWSLIAGEALILEGHGGQVYSASFSPDGNQVVTASWDGTARIWDLRSGASTIFEGHQGHVYDANFSPDGSQIVTASDDGTARVWDLNTARFITLPTPGTKIYSASFSPNNSYVITTSDDGTAKVWNTPNQNSTSTKLLTNEIINLSFSPDGQQIAFVSRGQAIRVWNLRNDTLTSLTEFGALYSTPIFSPDGSKIAGATESGVTLWDSSNNHVRLLLDNANERIEAIALSSDGTQLASASGRGKITLVNLENGNQKTFPGLHQDRVTRVAFSPDNRKVVTTALDDTAVVWDLEADSFVILKNVYQRRQDVSVSQFPSVYFHPNSNQIIFTTWGTTQVWDLKTGQFSQINNSEDWVNSAKFSPNGNQVVLALGDGTARIVDLQTRESTTFEGHERPVTDASFSPNGKQVVTVSWDSTTRIWDLQGRQLAIFDGYRAAFSSDWRRLATVSNNRIQVHELNNLPELIAWGCQWLDNYLKYGQATDADRAICNLPPRDSAPTGPFESSLGRSLVQVQVTWPGQG